MEVRTLTRRTAATLQCEAPDNPEA